MSLRAVRLVLLLGHLAPVMSRRASLAKKLLAHEDQISESSGLCKKSILSGCQPSEVCEQDYEGHCDLKYDEDLVSGLNASKSSLLSKSEAYHGHHRIRDLVGFIPKLQSMSLYSKAFLEYKPSDMPLLATEMNTSQAEILGAVSKVTDALQEQGGQAINFSAMFEIMGNKDLENDPPSMRTSLLKVFPTMAAKQVASTFDKVAATFAKVPACENGNASIACGKGLLANLLPTAAAQVEKLTHLLSQLEQKVLGTGLMQVEEKEVEKEVENLEFRPKDFLLCWAGKAVAILTFQYFLVLSVVFFALWIPFIPMFVAMLSVLSFLMPCSLYLVPDAILNATGLGALP